MPKVTQQNIKDLGFDNYEMFGLADDAALTAYITAAIASISATIEGRIGASTYALTTEPTNGRVFEAEKALVMAELIERRINRQLVNAQGQGDEINTKSEREQLKNYRNRAEDLLGILESSEFAAGSVISDHFGSVTS